MSKVHQGPNGSAGRPNPGRSARAARAVAASADAGVHPGDGREPFGAVLDLGRRASRGVAMAGLLALFLHGTAAARAWLMPIELLHWTQHVTARVRERLWTEIDVEMRETPPEPPPPPPEEEAKPEPTPPPPVAKAVAKDEPPPPPPAAAAAAPVLTQKEDPNEPVDFTNSIVTGTGNTFAGGVTQQGGTSTVAVDNMNARANGVVGGTGAPTPTPGPDLSRPAKRRGGLDMDCSWPSSAEASDLDEAFVELRVSVRADGAVSNVDILKDPGFGLGAQAKRCALREAWDPALDREGKAMNGFSKVLRVRFERN